MTRKELGILCTGIAIGLLLSACMDIYIQYKTAPAEARIQKLFEME